MLLVQVVKDRVSPGLTPMITGYREKLGLCHPRSNPSNIQGSKELHRVEDTNLNILRVA